MRASTLLCKVFLQHLTTLARLSTFTALWLTILDYMDKYMKSDKSDLLHDVIPESLKNMLLVMETTGLFNQNNSNVKFSQLCVITKDRIESFLPGLWEDLFKLNAKNIQQQLLAQQQAELKAEQAVRTAEEVSQATPQTPTETNAANDEEKALGERSQSPVSAECTVQNENELIASSCLSKSNSATNASKVTELL